ncbi:hypothetical protein [Anaerocolumna xylanovorans]|uniref:PAP2 superfamily protein n=1 Tax=Anaerocolumna xylanovorans DSM 12503 TaxID=1121345 RepID=A0A1M7XY88_9FIRM|nr:hypothetical protein [Anaerocolumna xylanovorans]SHO43964.1 hypothetical protein SAMN02745217_00419 [Anaerocolumna xylanovorans DSM 12503]
MNSKEKAAKIIRIISVPPIMALSLLLVAFFFKNEIYNRQQDFVFSIAALVVFPILAYPASEIFIRNKENKRERQRNFAFVFSLIGYTALLIYGAVFKVSSDMTAISLTYFLTVVILTLFNKIFKIKASGHAASCTSPLIFFIYFWGWPLIFPCGIAFTAILWSSLELKRHSLKEFFIGAGICILSVDLSLFGVWFI